MQARFMSWEIKAQQQISQLKEAFPEKVRSVQKALAEREIMHAEAKSLHHLKEVGLLTEKAWAESHEKIIRGHDRQWQPSLVFDSARFAGHEAAYSS
jgi:hypothetical protein